MNLVRPFVLAAALAAAPAAIAQVAVTDPWVRGTVESQKATGAFMQLTASQPTTLVGVASPVAGVAEVHEMKMDGDVMRMRALPQGLPLPAGQPVALTPGGYHVMLMDLKATLPKDSTIPLTLTFKDAKGVESRVELKLPVATTAPGGAAAPAGHKH